MNLFRKITIVVFSLVFRARHLLFTGVIRVDRQSISRVLLGKSVSMKGKLVCYESDVQLAKRCIVAKTASVGADGGGFIALGEDVILGERTILSTCGGRLEVGRGTSFFSDCLISGNVIIGEDCLFANNVTVLSSTHQIHGDGTIRQNDAAVRSQFDYCLYEDVSIGDDCWLGANAVVLPGVSISKGTVVGANAVVSKTFPEYSVLTGVPAKVSGSRDRYAKKPELAGSVFQR